MRSPEYVANVLRPSFEHARAQLFAPLLLCSMAHVTMLTHQNLLAREAGAAALGALCQVAAGGAASFHYDEAFEDLFFQVEHRVLALAGEAAGSMNMALSRNDLDAAIYRMALREELLALLQEQLAVRALVLDLAHAHAATLMPAHTHGQQAQPTTLGHYLLAATGHLERDTARLLGCYRRTNRSPMGACALAGTGFGIDRHYTADLLGFDGLVANTYDAVCAADHMLEAAAALQVLAANLSRLVTDLLFWATSEVGVLRLADPLVQVSSIMPQKRNPVALEHLRAILSRMLGAAGPVFALAHNVPLGDVNDVGDDLQPAIFALTAEGQRALQLLRAVLAGASFDTERLARRTAGAWVVSTELADALARSGLTFRQAHGVVAQLVRSHPEGPGAVDAAAVDAAALSALGRPAGLGDEETRAALDPRQFVARRATAGGPAPEALAQALAAAGSALQADRRAVITRSNRLAAARRRLGRAVHGLCGWELPL